jgi:LmbE family N-acetylglucosaminyl deacetylase
MKPTSESGPLLAFGAHPDDIEFGCGGVVALETRRGRAAEFVVCSRGEAGTNGTPEERTREAEKAASILGARLRWLELDGDAKLEVRAEHIIRLARLIRELRPQTILAPSLVQNQHPDHWRLAQCVRDAARLARYGGLAELKELPPHAIEQLLFYHLAADPDPVGVQPILIDVSDVQILKTWTDAMEAHASQMKTRRYAELQLARATVTGGRCGVRAAIALYPNDPLVFGSLAPLARKS